VLDVGVPGSRRAITLSSDSTGNIFECGFPYFH
jgi:hypothetical protein